MMTLNIGTKAPDFKSLDQDGNEVSLSSLNGKKIVLYFYPRDMTPGCTAEACNLRDNYRALQKAGYVVLGVSTDTEKSHKKFVEKEKLPFRLLADTHKTIHEKYGAWIEKSMYGRKYMGTARVTYLINEQGMISEVIEKVDTRDHARQILGGATVTPEKKVVNKIAKKPAASKVKKKK